MPPAMYVLFELPPSLHAVSVQPRVALDDFLSVVPPTAVTCADVLGYDGPSPPLRCGPSSPAATKMPMPGWL